MVLISNILNNPMHVAINADPRDNSILYFPVIAMNLPEEMEEIDNVNCIGSIRTPDMVAELSRTT